MIRNTLAVAWKDLLIVLKDRGALAVFFLMPLLFASLLGMAFGNTGNEETTIEVAVLLVNQDSGTYGQMLADGLNGDGVLVVEELNDATLADERIASGDAPAATDGISIVPTLLDSGQQRRHEYLYWERPGSHGGGQALRMGRWKGIRVGLKKDPDASVQLFDLARDLGESRDVARAHPAVAATVRRLMGEARTDSPHFPLFRKKSQ